MLTMVGPWSSQSSFCVVLTRVVFPLLFGCLQFGTRIRLVGNWRGLIFELELFNSLVEPLFRRLNLWLYCSSKQSDVKLAYAVHASCHMRLNLFMGHVMCDSISHTFLFSTLRLFCGLYKPAMNLAFRAPFEYMYVFSVFHPTTFQKASCLSNWTKKLITRTTHTSIINNFS